MAGLLQIEEPARAGRRGSPRDVPSWSALLDMGFRPLYMAGGAWAAISVAIWIFAPAWLVGRMPGVYWHAHEMLWGVIATIAAGFLLTAATNWTGINPMRGAPLGVFTALWLAARIGFLVPGDPAFLIAGTCEVLGFAWVAAALARVVHRARSRRNLGLPWLMLGLAASDAWYLAGIREGAYLVVMQRLQAGMLCMAVIALLIGRRVIPFFAMRAVEGLSVPMHTRSGQWQLAAGVAAIGCHLAGQALAEAVLLGVAGGFALVQVLTWEPWRVRRVPLLWILYIGYAGLAAGLLVSGLHASGALDRGAWPAHVIGVAGFSVLIIGMITRTALGHLGRPLRTDRLIVSCYMLVIVAALARLAALVPGPWTLAALHASAACWVLAFALYLWRFVPMMIRPRIDAQAAQVQRR
ncbi:MAG: NnrS family protein [Burkholderiaceae bacterium]